MTPILRPTNIRETTLWNHLNTAFEGGDGELDARTLAASLVQICGEAHDRMRGFPSLHAQYTLHDETHLLRVTELITMLMSDQVLQNELNVVEVALLILIAHFHDQGMVLDRGEIEALGNNPEFQIFERDWEIEHPNLKEVRQRLRDRNLSEEEQARCRAVEQELRAALLTDYIRRSHARRSHDFVLSRYGSDPRWIIAGTNLSRLVAMLCESHYRPASDLTPANGFYHDESVGTYQVNLPYLALLLRLADLLDFDRERTPEPLYRTIHFTNEVSLSEWEKHRAVDGWIVSPAMIRFSARCEHPAYERAVREFMDYIDHELSAAHTLVMTFPANGARYTLDLPTSVDRSRIGARDGEYIYHDLEFSLSRDEVVKLLMTDALYESPSLCVRELLQNSLDALRHREAMFRRDTGNEWGNGKVKLEHLVDNHGYEVLRCTDNGVGMDEGIITKFLTNAGRSYYRSPEFEQERASFTAAGVDFDPCAQFGIGFMSCFMIGDRIIIRTRRHYGPNRGLGMPLIVEINGLGGIVTLRPGSTEQQAGTVIEVIGRKKPRFLDSWDDLVQLVGVVDGYALACEFPIQARCSVPGIEDALNIPPTAAIRKTNLERTSVERYITLEQEFSEIDQRLGGRVRASFLIDEQGRPTIANDEAAWSVSTEQTRPRVHLNLLTAEETSKGYLRDEGQTCQDGILVCGGLGRSDDSEDRFWVRGTQWANLIDLGEDYFVLDVRGTLKPPLTPARVPPSRGFGRASEDPRWKRLQMLSSLAHGRLWRQVAQRLEDAPDGATLWQLLSIHRASVSWMPAEAIWSHVRIPVLSTGDDVSWQRFASIGALQASQEEDSFTLVTEEGNRVSFPNEVKRWRHENIDSELEWILRNAILNLSTVSVEGNMVWVAPREPSYPDRAPWEVAFQASFSHTPTLEYTGPLSGVLSAQLPFVSVNRNHPLTEAALAAQHLEDPSAVQQFFISAAYCLSNSHTFEALNDPNGGINHQMRRVGQRYFDVDWAGVADPLKPPYTIWLREQGEVHISHADFERWATDNLETTT